jgi:hypothetical protein
MSRFRLKAEPACPYRSFRVRGSTVEWIFGILGVAILFAIIIELIP